MGMNEFKISISKKPSFDEVWYEGAVEKDGVVYKFWLIDPQGKDLQGREYDCEIRWFFKQVPREIRNLSSQIIKLALDEIESSPDEMIALLKASVNALNSIPNKPLKLEKYRNTYALASDIDKLLDKYKKV